MSRLLRERFLHVTGVQVQEGYVLRLTFDNGVNKVVDLESELHGEVFEPLRDRAFFARVAVNEETATIEWLNGADFAPEFLFGAGVELAAMSAGSGAKQ